MDRLKAIVPSVVWRAARRSSAYSNRLRTWIQVLREVRGVSREDQRQITTAFCRSPLVSFRDLDNWQNPELLKHAQVEVRGIGRFHARAQSDDLYHVLPSREPEVIATLQRYLTKGSVFVDAGANIGFFTVFGSKLVGSTGTVVAAEMMSDTAAILRRHVEENGCLNVTIIEAAVSDTAGCEAKAHVIDGKFGMASIVSGSGRTVIVRTSTLDEILRDIPRVDLLKMDLEGAELLAIHGAEDSLKKIGVIVFEELDGSRVSEILKIKGYCITELSAHTRLAVR